MARADRGLPREVSGRRPGRAGRCTMQKGGMKGKGDLSGMLSEGEAKPTRGWSRDVKLRGGKVAGRPQGPAFGPRTKRELQTNR